jgi:hypothetical protein
MAEITKDISATQAEYIRQELAASIFFSMPRADADWNAKFDSYNRIRQLIHIIEMVEGKEPDGKALGLKETCFTYSYEDDTLDFCAECNDGDARPPLLTIHVRPIETSNAVAHCWRNSCVPMTSPPI